MSPPSGSSESEKDSEKTSGGAESSEGKSDCLSECSEDYDVFELEQEKNATWITFEDQDELIAQVIREHLRPRPLVPLDPRCSEKVFAGMESGIALPQFHCAFLDGEGKPCTWCSQPGDARNAFGKHIYEVHLSLGDNFCKDAGEIARAIASRLHMDLVAFRSGVARNGLQGLLLEPADKVWRW